VASILLKFSRLLIMASFLSGCSNLFFYPERELVVTPKELNIRFEEVSVPLPDNGTLHGWYLPAEGKEIGTLLFFHGNAQNISYHLASVYWLPKENFSVFLFD
jgi:uncharacterized protein